MRYFFIFDKLIVNNSSKSGDFAQQGDTENIIADNFMIIDNLGRIISNHKPNTSKTTLNIDSFTDGIYYVKINYQDKNVTKKLILKKN